MGTSNDLNVPATPVTSPDRSSVIAELMNLDPDAEVPVETESEDSTAESPDTVETPVDGEEPVGDLEAAADLQAAEPVVETTQMSKQLNFLKQQERKLKSEMQAREGQLHVREQELTQAYHAIENFKQAAQAAHRDPAGLLLSLGFSEEQLQEAAQDIFFSSASAKAHPQYKQAYERAKGLRQSRAEAEMARQKAEEVDRKLQELQYSTRNAELMATYKSQLTEAVGASTPFLAMHMKHDREQARNALMTVAESMYRQTNATPDPLEVAKELEKRLQRDLSVYGVRAPGQTPTPQAQKPKANKTLTNGLSGRTASQSEEEDDPKALRASVLRDLETGNY